MRVKKTNSVYKPIEVTFPRITEPNQSFSPRQIIEQFSRGELSAKTFEPSDMIDSDSFSDDHMVDNVIEFEDQFSALEYMKTTRLRKEVKNASEPKDDSEEIPKSSGAGSEEEVKE